MHHIYIGASVDLIHAVARWQRVYFQVVCESSIISVFFIDVNFDYSCDGVAAKFCEKGLIVHDSEGTVEQSN